MTAKIFRSAPTSPRTARTFSAAASRSISSVVGRSGSLVISGQPCGPRAFPSSNPLLVLDVRIRLWVQDPAPQGVETRRRGSLSRPVVPTIPDAVLRQLTIAGPQRQRHVVANDDGGRGCPVHLQTGAGQLGTLDR